MLLGLSRAPPREAPRPVDWTAPINSPTHDRSIQLCLDGSRAVEGVASVAPAPVDTSFPGPQKSYKQKVIEWPSNHNNL
jgi:hypothetical protein